MGSIWQSTFPGVDMAWIGMNDESSWPTRPTVLNYAGGQQNVYGGREAPVGAAICRSGGRTGYRCGSITSKNVTLNYPQGTVYGMTGTNACSGAGDSGGSVLTPGGEAQGVHSGGNAPQGGENCSLSSPTGYFQPLQPLLNAYPGMSLKTVSSCGRLNPGRTITSSEPVNSCDGRFRFTMLIDGDLVLTKNFLTIIWSNRVSGSGHRLAMQPDGNLVVYNGSNNAVWSSRTSGRNGAALFVQDDGNVVLYSHTGVPIWSTGTAGR
jgi:streptogrisin C